MVAHPAAVGHRLHETRTGCPAHRAVDDARAQAPDRPATSGSSGRRTGRASPRRARRVDDERVSRHRCVRRHDDDRVGVERHERCGGAAQARRGGLGLLRSPPTPATMMGGCGAMIPNVPGATWLTSSRVQAGRTVPTALPTSVPSSLPPRNHVCASSTSTSKNVPGESSPCRPSGRQRARPCSSGCDRRACARRACWRPRTARAARCRQAAGCCETPRQCTSSTSRSKRACATSRAT